MNLADIIAIIIILAFVIWGIKKGFMQSVFSLGSFIIALVLALMLSPIVSEMLETSFIGDYVHKSAYEMLVNEEATEEKTEKISAALPLPDMMTKTVRKEAEETALGIQKQFAENAADTALSILSTVIVFFLVKFFVFLLSHFLDLISRLPVLRSANKLLGGVFGAVYGILIIYMLLTVLTFGATVKTLQTPLEHVLESRVVSMMYHQNILLNFLQ